MLFHSIEYLIFLPVVFILYWILNRKTNFQNILLLVASYVFYGWWDWRFLSLLMISSLLDFMVGNQMYTAPIEKKKIYLWISLVCNLGILGFFKYFNFFSDSFKVCMEMLGFHIGPLTLNIILPIGISFYTFQTLSYTIDIYRGKLQPAQNWIDFFTYVSFFPQLVAGPIERANDLLPQLETARRFSYAQFKCGILQLIIGLVKKVVIADNLAVYVDTIYGDLEIYNSSTLLLATFFYAFQIYFDFSGYSDMALGTARLFGFRFSQNFQFPYFSKSLTEFWKRWHITLSKWLKDYLYIPLGGNKQGTFYTARNLMLTMLLGGIWHGNSWNFLIWGGIHGIFLCIEKSIFTLFRIQNFSFIGGLYTFIVVLISWFFFRTQSLDETQLILKKMSQMEISPPLLLDTNKFSIIILVLICGIFFDLFQFVKEITIEDMAIRLTTPLYLLVFSMIIVFICLFYSTSENFIYFQF